MSVKQILKYGIGGAIVATTACFVLATLLFTFETIGSAPRGGALSSTCLAYMHWFAGVGALCGIGLLFVFTKWGDTTHA